MDIFSSRKSKSSFSRNFSNTNDKFYVSLQYHHIIQYQYQKNDWMTITLSRIVIILITVTI